jgi:RNA-directed DNA polymerase
LGNLSTPKIVQKLQTALHAKAKAEAGYRFYALYDKISREDILAHAYAQCRSNKGAPGVDGQDFADIEKYGLQRWLGELALALRQETYRPDPIRRVYIPKANGKLRPLGISTLRDRVCMDMFDLKKPRHISTPPNNRLEERFSRPFCCLLPVTCNALQRR